jgi:hypothetical protein
VKSHVMIEDLCLCWLDGLELGSFYDGTAVRIIYERGMKRVFGAFKPTPHVAIGPQYTTANYQLITLSGKNSSIRSR